MNTKITMSEAAAELGVSVAGFCDLAGCLELACYWDGEVARVNANAPRLIRSQFPHAVRAMRSIGRVEKTLCPPVRSAKCVECGVEHTPRCSACVGASR